MDIPRQFFVPSQIFFIALWPLNDVFEKQVYEIQTVGSGEQGFVPVFTSIDKARSAAQWLLSSVKATLVPFTLNRINALGQLLDGLKIIGHRNLVVDPEPNREPVFIPIKSVTDALQDHLFGFRPGGAPSPN